MRRPPVSACVLTILVVPFACVGRAAAADPVIAAAGDIACAHDDSHYNGGAGTPGFCRQRATSDLMVGAGLAAVLPLGDIQYDSASATDLNAVYDPTWGRVKRSAARCSGNHEGAGADYFDYFNGKVRRTARPGSAARAGTASTSAAGTSSRSTRTATAWAVRPARSRSSGCARTSRRIRRPARSPTGTTRATAPGTTAATRSCSPSGRRSTTRGADIVLSGHGHDYERFAPLDPQRHPGAGRRRHPPVRRGHRRRVLHRRPRHAVPNSQVARTTPSASCS